MWVRDHSCRGCCGGCPSAEVGGSAGRSRLFLAARRGSASCVRSALRSTRLCCSWSAPQTPRIPVTTRVPWFAESHLPYIDCPPWHSPLRFLQLWLQFIEEGVSRWDDWEWFLWFLLFEFDGGVVEPLGLFWEVEIDLQSSSLAILLMKHFNNKIIKHPLLAHQPPPNHASPLPDELIRLIVGWLTQDRTMLEFNQYMCFSLIYVSSECRWWCWACLQFESWNLKYLII